MSLEQFFCFHHYKREGSGFFAFQKGKRETVLTVGHRLGCKKCNKEKFLVREVTKDEYKVLSDEDKNKIRSI
jgi:hypothetical protein